MTVRFLVRPDVLRLEIQDDGLASQGRSKFRVHEQRAHCGIAGMRERVVELGGRFDVKHVSEKGTSVAATIPLRVCTTPTVAVWS